jgi:hypothetical protein
MTSQAVRYDRGSPVIAVVNESERADDRDLARVLRALQKQIDQDFFPLWGWRADLVFARRRRRAMQIVIKDEPDTANTPAYHFIEGLPTTYVFTQDDDGKPIEYHSAISHEALEMIADPGVNLYAAGYYIKSRRHYHAWIPYEVCDPVQDNWYAIDGIRMSDFVVPEWFEAERERRSMKFSFRDSVSEPFAIAKGGYVDAVVGKRIRTVWGVRANRKKRRHRLEARAELAGLRRGSGSR